ncbi:MAG: DUF951 domain-containing protein [Chloroflexi bacterium]|nr:DUF951 domain-containing protein [Chloroflexota bacterium]MBT17669.1 DUF951 domain-containing protein [Dehalococcoidia bacterium]
MVKQFHLGDILTLRKSHPCGGNSWRVERIGADIGIRCLLCNHYLVIPRSRIEKRVKVITGKNKNS